MIKVSMLKKLLDQLPGDALVSAYEGEDTGINVHHGDLNWWIRCRYDYPHKKEKTFTTGFDYENWGNKRR